MGAEMVTLITVRIVGEDEHRQILPLPPGGDDKAAEAHLRNLVTMRSPARNRNQMIRAMKLVIVVEDDEAK